MVTDQMVGRAARVGHLGRHMLRSGICLAAAWLVINLGVPARARAESLAEAAMDAGMPEEEERN